MKKLIIFCIILFPSIIYSQSQEYTQVKKYAKYAFQKYINGKIKDLNVEIKEWENQGDKYFIKFEAKYKRHYILTGWESNSQLMQMYCDLNGDNLKIKGVGIFSELSWTKFGSVY